MGNIKFTKDERSGDRRTIAVGDRVEYRTQTSDAWLEATVTAIEAYVPGSVFLADISEVMEYVDGDDIDLVYFHVKLDHHKEENANRWGYWAQVRLP